MTGDSTEGTLSFGEILAPPYSRRPWIFLDGSVLMVRLGRARFEISLRRDQFLVRFRVRPKVPIGST
jgi:hypothetical protein